MAKDLISEETISDFTVGLEVSQVHSWFLKFTQVYFRSLIVTLMQKVEVC